MEKTELYRLALEQAQHDLDAQAGTLESLRGRSSALLGAAAIALGITSRNAGRLDVAAVVVLAVMAVGVALIHYPWVWTFDQEVTTLLDELDASGDVVDAPGIYRHRAEAMQKHRRDNGGKLEWLTRAYVVVCVLLPVELGLAVLRLR